MGTILGSHRAKIVIDMVVLVLNYASCVWNLHLLCIVFV